MTAMECPRESDVLSVVITGQWPTRVPDELRAHVASCQTCTELAVAAHAIDTEAEAARPLSRELPGSGTVWWRAQLRARQEAARDAVRPMTAAHALGLAALFAAGGAVFGASAQWFQAGLRSFKAGIGTFFAQIELPSLPLPIDGSTLWSGHGTMLVITIIGLAAAAGIIGWAMRED